MEEKFDPDEKEEKDENNNSDAGNVVSDVLFSGNPFDEQNESKTPITEGAENIQDNAAEVTENVADAADEIEIMSIQDIADELSDGVVNVASDIIDGIFDNFFD